MKNFYAILNIDINASKKEIKKSYRVLAVKYHPDKNKGDEKLTHKFLEVKEAYDTLINPEFRQKYDIKFTSYFQNTEKRKFDEENFYENSFNKSTIESDDTPQYRPPFDLFGKKIDEKFDFFILPKKIGIIIGAYSDYNKEVNYKPLEAKQAKKQIIYSVVVNLIVYALILYFGAPNILWSILWLLISTIVIVGGVYISTSGRSAENIFVGTHGFSWYSFSDEITKINTVKNIKFKNLTDVYVHYVEKSKNYSYDETDYEFIFFYHGRKRYSTKGSFDKKDDIKDQPFELNFCRKIEQSWNIYLLNTIEDKLKKEGYLNFNLYSFGEIKEYIKMGIGEITFIREDKEFTYNYDDIKNVYTRGNDLYIEHSNFERKFYFIKSGDADKIPLLELCNRSFFLKSFEILLGYSI